MKDKVHFIDCGANVGQTVRWVLGEYRDRLCRIDSFEPQTENFKVLEERYAGKEKVFLNQKAVWTEDGEKIFFLQNWGARTGSSLVRGKSSTSQKTIEKVECIDLARWIRENTIAENYNILKLDVEGAEYDIIPHLLEMNIHNIIDEWCIEFHGSVKTPNYDPDVITNIKKYAKKIVDWGEGLK